MTKARINKDARYEMIMIIGHFYSATYSTITQRPTTTAFILNRSFTPKRIGNCELRTCPRLVNVAARVGFEPTTLRSKGVDSTNAPLGPMLIRAIITD